MSQYNIEPWIEKAWREVTQPQEWTLPLLHPVDQFVGLIPAKTDTAWFHDHVLKRAAEVRFLRGRLKFGGSKNGAPFPSMVVVYR